MLSANNAWTGTNTFNTSLPTSTLTPSLTTQLITKAFADSTYTKPSSNNVWTGTNSFNTSLPTSTLTPSAATQLITKAYSDSTYAALAGAVFTGDISFPASNCTSYNGSAASVNRLFYNVSTGSVDIATSLSTGALNIGGSNSLGSVSLWGPKQVGTSNLFTSSQTGVVNIANSQLAGGTINIGSANSVTTIQGYTPDNINLSVGSSTPNYLTFSSTATGQSVLSTDSGLKYNVTTQNLSTTSITTGNGSSVSNLGVYLGNDLLNINAQTRFTYPIGQASSTIPPNIGFMGWRATGNYGMGSLPGNSGQYSLLMIGMNGSAINTSIAPNGTYMIISNFSWTPGTNSYINFSMGPNSTTRNNGCQVTCNYNSRDGSYSACQLTYTTSITSTTGNIYMTVLNLISSATGTWLNQSYDVIRIA